MIKTFSSVREMFRCYIPDYVKETDREEAERPGLFKQIRPYRDDETNKVVKKLLEDFGMSL